MDIVEPVYVTLGPLLFKVFSISSNGWIIGNERSLNFNDFFNLTSFTKQDLIFVLSTENISFLPYNNRLPLIILIDCVLYYVLNDENQHVFKNTNELDDNYIKVFLNNAYYILYVGTKNVIDINAKFVNNVSTEFNVYQQPNSMINMSVIVPVENNYNCGITCNGLVPPILYSSDYPLFFKDMVCEYLNGIKFEREYLDNELKCSYLGMKLLTDFNKDVKLIDMNIRYLMINFLTDECSNLLKNKKDILCWIESNFPVEEKQYVPSESFYKEEKDKFDFHIHFKGPIVDITNGFYLITRAYFHHETNDYICYNSFNTYLFDFLGLYFNQKQIESFKLLFDNCSIDSIYINKNTSNIYVRNVNGVYVTPKNVVKPSMEKENYIFDPDDDVIQYEDEFNKVHNPYETPKRTFKNLEVPEVRRPDRENGIQHNGYPYI